MHYYQFNIGNYRRDTMHLSPLEHGIYRMLLDSYYLSEAPLNTDKADVMRTHSIRTAEEKQAFENVLKDFFVLAEDGYRHKDCDEKIEKYQEKSDKARASAQARWAPKEENANGMRTHSEGNANQEPKTKNQEPKKKNVPKYSKRDYKAAEYFLETLLSDQPDFKKPNLGKWADTIRLMREQDERTYEDIYRVWVWARKDGFWSKNILGPVKLREKFDQLKANMREKPNDKPAKQQFLDPDDIAWADTLEDSAHYRFDPDSGQGFDQLDLPPIEGDFSGVVERCEGPGERGRNAPPVVTGPAGGRH